MRLRPNKLLLTLILAIVLIKVGGQPFQDFLHQAGQRTGSLAGGAFDRTKEITDRVTGHAADAQVERIVDGDTIKVRIKGQEDTVRYIGMDTPETVKPRTPVQCYGKAASAYNTQLLAHEQVILKYDRRQRDRYGRLLAYVYRKRDGLFVNAELVRKGYAREMRVPPNVAQASRISRIERRARSSRRGLWNACR